MTELFNGGEIDAFYPSDSNPIETSSIGFNPDFARCAIGISGLTSYIETAHWSAQTEAYHHWELMMSQASFFDYTVLELCDASDDPQIQIRATRTDTTTHTLTLRYSDGMGGWTTADTVSLSTNIQTFDLHWLIDASGELDLYIAGTKRIEFTGDLSGLNAITYARHYGGYVKAYYSQVFTDTEPTIGERLYTLPPSATGTNTAWTGTYTEVDEIPYSDADFINSGTANQVETFGITAPTLTGYVVQSVTVSARAKYDGSGPSNIQLALRSGGTDYFSSSQALDVGYEPHQNIWETNPATSAAWVNTAISALQPGVKSIT